MDPVDLDKQIEEAKSKVKRRINNNYYYYY